MNENNRLLFNYAILRYVHDAVTGEFLNIGLALFCPQKPFFKARMLTQYARLTHAFPNADGEFYRGYVGRLQTIFDKLAHDINSQQIALLLDITPQPATLQALLNRALPTDDSAFQFGEIRGGVVEASNIETFFAHTFERVVTQYIEKPTQHSRDDDDIWASFKKPLNEKKVLSHLVRYTVLTQYEEFEFPHALKNGRWHVFESTSFDLVQAKSIQNKVRSLHAKVELVTEKQKDLTVWVLVGKPNTTDEAVNKAYQKAIGLLNNKTSLLGAKIIMEDAATQFAEEIAHLLEHP